MRIIVGIDPGLTGAMAVLNEAGDLETISLPTLGGQDRILDGGRIARWLGDRDVTEAIIERAQAMSKPGAKQGVVGMFRYGTAYGQLLGVLQASLIPYTTVPAATWKKTYRLWGGDKQDSIRRAIELFPRHADQFSRKADNHRAEAALLARYGLCSFCDLGSEPGSSHRWVEDHT